MSAAQTDEKKPEITEIASISISTHNPSRSANNGLNGLLQPQLSATRCMSIMSHCHHINPYILIAGQEALAEADYWQRPPDGFSPACPLFPVKNCIGQPRLWRNSCCFQMLLLLWNWKCGANAAGAKRINPSSCVRMVLQKMFYMSLVMVKITVRTMSWPK